MPLSPVGAPSLSSQAGPTAGPVGEALAAALPLPAGAALASIQRAATPAATIELSPVAVLQHGLETLVAAAKQIGPALAEFARTTEPTPGSLPGVPSAAPPGATPPGSAALRLAAAIGLAGTAAQAVGNAIETALLRPVAARQGRTAGQGAAGEPAQSVPAAGGSASPGFSPAPPTAALPPSLRSPLPATPDSGTPPRAGQPPFPRLPDATAGHTGLPHPARGAIDALSGTDEALQAVRQHLESVPEGRAVPATREAAVVQAALLPAEAQLARAAAQLVAILPATPGLAPLRDRARRAAGAAVRRPGLAFRSPQGPPSWHEPGPLLPLGTAALVTSLLIAADRPLIRVACAAIGLLAGAVLVARLCRKLRLVVAAPARRKDG